MKLHFCSTQGAWIEAQGLGSKFRAWSKQAKLRCLSYLEWQERAMVFITSGHIPSVSCGLWKWVCARPVAVCIFAFTCSCDGSCPIAPEQMFLCNPPVPSPCAWMTTYRHEQGCPSEQRPCIPDRECCTDHRLFVSWCVVPETQDHLFFLIFLIN